MKAILTIGVSASGKTTWAEKYALENDFVNICRDDIRFRMIGVRDWSKWKFKNEKKVTEEQYALISSAAKDGKNIIISDTNLHPHYRNKLISFLNEVGYDVDIVTFPVTFEEAVARDNGRANGVGYSVIAKQMMLWDEYVGTEKVVSCPDLPTAILCDIDGTLAHMQGRGPFDWSLVDKDTVDDVVKHIVNSFKASGCNVILLSGRDSCCRGLTEKWLSDNGIMYDVLHMRPATDMRKDTVVKKEMFDTFVRDKYNVLTVIDDRPSVVRMWMGMGLKVLNVGNPYIEF